MAWYRPPKYEYQTIDKIETLLKYPDAEDKEIILMGDVNCNDLDIEGKNKILVSLHRGGFLQWSGLVVGGLKSVVGGR